MNQMKIKYNVKFKVAIATAQAARNGENENAFLLLESADMLLGPVMWLIKWPTGHFINHMTGPSVYSMNVVLSSALRQNNFRGRIVNSFQAYLINIACLEN